MKKGVRCVRWKKLRKKKKKKLGAKVKEGLALGGVEPTRNGGWAGC